MAAEEAFVIDSARTIEDIVPAQHRWLFTRRGEEGQPLLALHPRKNNDDYRRVTFLAEATRPADLIVVDQFETCRGRQPDRRPAGWVYRRVYSTGGPRQRQSGSHLH